MLDGCDCAVYTTVEQQRVPLPSSFLLYTAIHTGREQSNPHLWANLGGGCVCTRVTKYLTKPKLTYISFMLCDTPITCGYCPRKKTSPNTRWSGEARFQVQQKNVVAVRNHRILRWRRLFWQNLHRWLIPKRSFVVCRVECYFWLPEEENDTAPNCFSVKYATTHRDLNLVLAETDGKMFRMTTKLSSYRKERLDINIKKLNMRLPWLYRCATRGVQPAKQAIILQKFHGFGIWLSQVLPSFFRLNTTVPQANTHLSYAKGNAKKLQIVQAKLSWTFIRECDYSTFNFW